MNSEHNSSRLQLTLFPTQQHRDDFEANIKRILKFHRVINGAPGLSCAICVNPLSSIQSTLPSSSSNLSSNVIPLSSELIYQGNVGYSDLNTMTKMNSTHTMMTASITKFITSVLIGRLIELGVMSFDDLHCPIYDIFSQGLTNDVDTLSLSSIHLSTNSNYWLYNTQLYKDMAASAQSRYIYGTGNTTTPYAIHPTLIQHMTHTLTRAKDYFLSLSSSSSNLNSSKSKSNSTSPSAATTSSPSSSPSPSHVHLFPESFHEITLAQLLSHTAGIRDYNIEENEDCSSIHYPNVFSAIQQFIWDPLLQNEIQSTAIPTISAPTLPSSMTHSLPNFQPKQRSHAYTTFGYCLIEAVIECCYFNYIQKYIREIVTPTTDDIFNQKITNLNFHPPTPIQTSFSFQAIIQQFVAIPLHLYQLQHEMIRTTASQNRSTEYTRFLYPRAIPFLTDTSLSTSIPNISNISSTITPVPSASSQVEHKQTVLPAPMPISTRTNRTLTPIILNKSNVGGCIVSNAATLARFGGVLTQSFDGKQVQFVSKHWLEYIHQYHFVHASMRNNHTKNENINGDNELSSLFFEEPPTQTKTKYPCLPPSAIFPQNSPSYHAYGLGCINHHNLLHLSTSSTANFHTLPVNSNMLLTNTPFVLSNPTLYHTGQGIGSSGILFVAPCDGISVAILANVGLTDLKDLGVDIATFVKTWINLRFSPLAAL